MVKEAPNPLTGISIPIWSHSIKFLDWFHTVKHIRIPLARRELDGFVHIR